MPERRAGFLSFCEAYEPGAGDDLPDIRKVFLASIVAVGEQALPLHSVYSMVRQPGPTLAFSHPVVARPFPWVTAVKLEPEIRRADASGVLDRAFGPNFAVFLARYLSICGSIRPDASTFDQVWAEYEVDRGRSDVPFRFEGLLEGLTGDFGDLVLGPQVRVKAITDEWRRQRCELDWTGLAFRNLSLDLIRCEYMLEIEVDLPRGSWGALNVPEVIADQAVTSLRLSCSGGVGLCRSWLEPTVPVFLQPFHGNLGRTRGAPQVRSALPWRGDAQVLRSLFEAVQRGGFDSRVELALRRFEGSYYRREPADRLLDYWIALETLFLPKQRTELAHLGPLRMALYLESTLPARTSLFERMRTSYDARSGIVHGDLDRKSTADLPNLEAETEAALRAALQRAVSTGSAPSKSELERLELSGVEIAEAPGERRM